MKRPVFRESQCHKQRIFTKNRMRIFMHICNSSFLDETHKQVRKECWTHELRHNPVLFMMHAIPSNGPFIIKTILYLKQKGNTTNPETVFIYVLKITS
jgi:hypothetical protein